MSKHEVICVVYRFSNKSRRDVAMRLPIYHTSVRVNGLEYEWGRVVDGQGTGRLVRTPRSEMGAIIEREILMGSICTDIYEAVDVDDYVLNVAKNIVTSNGSYNLLTNNCNHFTDRLCRELVGKGPPTYINRAANVSWMMLF